MDGGLKWKNLLWGVWIFSGTTQCHLDFFLVSQELIQLAKKCDIIHAPESNHSAVSLVLQSNHLNRKRGPGFWKFNTTLMKCT